MVETRSQKRKVNDSNDNIFLIKTKKIKTSVPENDPSGNESEYENVEVESSNES